MFPIRRKTTTIVTAHRAGDAPLAPGMPQIIPPIVIDSARAVAPQGVAPGVVPSTNGAAPHGTTQIFVIAPGAAPQPQPAPPPPTEIHHHHTTVQYTPRRRTAPYNTSFFGSAGLVLGVLSMFAAYKAASYLVFASPLAMAGAIAGGIGFLGAIVFRRTRVGLPVLALLLSAIGYVGWLYQSNQLQTQIDEIRTQFPQLPKVDLGQPAAAAPHAGTTTR